MDITVDNRVNDIIYVDRATLQHATTNDVVKFIANKDTRMTMIITNLISGEFCLNSLEKRVLEFIINCDGTVYVKDIIELISKERKVSKDTVRRAINKLETLNIIYIVDKSIIHVSSNYSKAVKKHNLKKLLIIELESATIANCICSDSCDNPVEE